MAYLHYLRTAVGELASLWLLRGVRHKAGDGHQPHHVDVNLGDGVEQPLGIGMFHSRENLLHTGRLHDFTSIHDGYMLAVLRNHTQVMGN
ncbi:hypothetical protein SDC9_160405 [bioreactor metagenome]|uniref:Uncharacterized protein n=1 Tax=bioreactor metagenome TaxID=1076179 RepID=A0A645FFA7_9ZZZZ